MSNNDGSFIGQVSDALGSWAPWWVISLVFPAKKIKHGYIVDKFWLFPGVLIYLIISRKLMMSWL